MKRSSWRWLTALFLIWSFQSVAAQAAAKGPALIEAERFAELPSGVRHPEGLTVDPDSGEFFVGTFDARMPENTRNNQLLRYSEQGKLIAQRSFGATPLTGLAFRDGQVYVSSKRDVCLHVPMSVPVEVKSRVPGRAGIDQLHETHAALCKPPRHQTLPAKPGGLASLQAVER